MNFTRDITTYMRKNSLLGTSPATKEKWLRNCPVTPGTVSGCVFPREAVGMWVVVCTPERQWGPHNVTPWVPQPMTAHLLGQLSTSRVLPMTTSDWRWEGQEDTEKTAWWDNLPNSSLEQMTRLYQRENMPGMNKKPWWWLYFRYRPVLLSGPVSVTNKEQKIIMWKYLKTLRGCYSCIWGIRMLRLKTSYINITIGLLGYETMWQ